MMYVCRGDKERYWTEVAEKMEFDAKNGRMKETFGVLKAAKSSIGRAMVSIKAKDGSIRDTEEG